MTREHLLIIGGGIIGALSAWSLRQEGFAGRISVIERDPTYRFASTALSAASIRTQFACPVNVELSLFGAQFLKNVSGSLGVEADIGFVENGYLILGDERTLPAREQALDMQRACGAAVERLEAPALAERFPWLSTDGVAMATFGTRDEGWFDAWSLLQAAKSAAQAADVAFVRAEATGFTTRGGRIVALETAGGEIAGDWFVNAAGAASARVARWLGRDLPVRARKRTVFHIKAPLDSERMPMLFDVSGAWMRPERDGFIAGIAPLDDCDPDADGDFEPDHALFEEALWPILAARVPALEELRVQSAWAGHYEMCLFDHNGIVGFAPEAENYILATGFSGHGVMHAPGVARGVAELVVHGAYRSIDLAPLGIERIIAGRPMPESAIY
ncbi:glycine/D-amino acid oxidase-like deaminating enzyme [Sphingopyxis panaciterrae]|uniref:NAD(P)/FAD-dependent oxidoreductase n=1 Tax=Sphingopyxis panaciterrae TaxID=363841 RepID=UPI001420DBAC|nr:FAD-binding oxidoreductase [Sphingopyxis panaciterrae]NIJ35975.1 glycine/D-amino acid oxidase-like deaminating enzyme [Sphingopyxis panaciterrae]